MKRARTKAEFIRRANSAVQNRDSDTAIGVDLAELAESFGAHWDPEEPELPKRVWVPPNISVLLPEGEKSLLDIPGREIRRFNKEAAARYNAIPNILADLGKIAQDGLSECERQHAESFAALVKVRLALERGKLQ